MSDRDVKHYMSRRKPLGENTTKSDGASLAPGSSEYREYIEDRKGMDEQEQTQAHLDDAGARETKEFSKTDDWHEKLAERNAARSKVASEARESHDSGRLSTAERDISHQIRKMAMTDAVMRRAVKIAGETETKADDKAVHRKLPKELKKAVYNNDVTEDDYFPGSKTLNKYL